jgi:putative radical SAM enzyme (TIGR03279 family)
MSVVENGQVVSSVISGSLAEELDIRPGDRLLCIDGKPVIDVFDYQVRQLQADLVILIEKLDKSQIEFELEKDEDEDLGLVFENPLLDDCNSCQKHCIFCFSDQLPQGLRKALYFKDDDMRMSFLHGNYVTLTNIDDEELDRIISYRFSPMNISVHATDPLVRMRMMRNRNSGNLYPRLKKLAAAGIDLNCQLVLCPGINDGEVLENTLSDLTALGQNVISIAMVPVGVTKYREEKNLFPVRSFSKEEAQKRGWFEVAAGTGRDRRAAPFDFELANKTAKINGATMAAMTKLDVLYPSCRGARKFDDLPVEAKDFVREVEKRTGVPVTLIGTGPEALDLIDRRV